MDEHFEIDPDIARAGALPPAVYLEPRWFERMRTRVFPRSWQFVGDAADVARPGACLPATFLEGWIDEPLLFVRDQALELRCLSNVCTHRGNLVCTTAGERSGLRCGYHGRRFGLDGRVQSMPEFGGVEGFPAPRDDLARVPFASWRRLLFASLDPACRFDELIDGLEQRVGFLPIEDAVPDPSRGRDWSVDAHWALYCDNYLEGFHIPFVHEALAAAIEFASYRTELLPWGTVQTAIARPGEAAFDLPPSSPDHGRRVAAYYFWLFPNTLLNFYPAGLSLNVVMPIAPARTRIVFKSWVWDRARLDLGAGAGLDRVELEDEAVVESAQRGIRSRFYPGGRYSPSQEAGVHHFHRLLARDLSGGPGGGETAGSR